MLNGHDMADNVRSPRHASFTLPSTSILHPQSSPRTLPAEGNNGSGTATLASGDGTGSLAVPPRPYWASVPPLLCLYLEDMVTLACAAATASTDDSELLELQEAGVRMLTEVVRIFGQVGDETTWLS